MHTFEVLTVKDMVMKCGTFVFIAISSTLMVTSCDLVDDSPCGVRETADMYLLGSSIVDSTNGLYYSYMEGNNRVFQWSQLSENVCAEEHVKAEARVALLGAASAFGIQARARVSWQFFFEKNIVMALVGDDFKGSGEAGLKQAFGMDPGWFVQTVEVFFPTKGSYSADTAFLREQIISVEMMSKYRRQ